MEDRTEDIAKYLNNDFTKEEQSAFERELSSNEVLRDELDLQRKLGDLLEESERLALKERVSKLNNSPREKKSYPFLKIAAVLVVGVLTGYFAMQFQYSDTALYEDYDAAYPDLVTTMGTNSDESQAAMEAYNESDYKSAALELKDLRIQNGITGLEIYEVVSYRKSGKTKEAIQLSKEMMRNNDGQSAVFEWELILCYLSSEQADLAEIQLKQFIRKGSGYKTKEALQLLEDIQSFWR
jgi:hypothetical protein